MDYLVCKADRRHLKDISRVLASANMGPLQRRPHEMWFIRKDGEIVGCIGADTLPGGVCMALRLAVDPRFRKCGIGKTLFEHVLERARVRGATSVGLVTMYYHFRRFKRYGFRTVPRKLAPERVMQHWMCTAPQFMKCAVMIRESV